MARREPPHLGPPRDLSRIGRCAKALERPDDVVLQCLHGRARFGEHQGEEPVERREPERRRAKGPAGCGEGRERLVQHLRRAAGRKPHGRRQRRVEAVAARNLGDALERFGAKTRHGRPREAGAGLRIAPEPGRAEARERRRRSGRDIDRIAGGHDGVTPASATGTAFVVVIIS